MSSAGVVGRWLCLAGAMLGMFGLVGWLMGVGALTAVVPGQAAMMPNAALALCLLGTAAALRERRDAGAVRKALAIGFALAALAIGVATLGQYALGMDFGIDQLLVRVEHGPYPGRPSPPTALAVTLLALAELVFDVRPHARTRPSEWLILVTVLTALLGLVGMLLGAGPLYRAANTAVVAVSLPTAISLLLISLGLLLERSSSGLMRAAGSPGPGGMLLRRFVLPMLVAPALLGLLATRLVAAFGLADEPLVVATLAATTTVAGLVLIAATATKIDRTHAALEAARARARDLIEHASDGIFVADPDGRCIEVNSAGCRMLGYPREQILGRRFIELLEPEDAARPSAVRDRLLQGEDALVELSLRCGDGRDDLPVEISARHLPDGRWEALVRNVSERRRLEHDLRQKHADLNRAQAVARIGSWRLDVRRNVLQWSDENYRIFGVPAGAPMTYDAFLACVHPEDRAFVHARWSAALRGEAYDIEHRLLVGDEVRWVREKADLEFDERGVLLGGVGITQDVTERKHHEQERARAHARIHEAQERLALALEGAGLAAWDWNVKTGAVVFSPRWAQLRGLRSEDVEPTVESWMSGVHPEDMPRVQKALADHFEGRTADYRSEHRVRAASGQWRWIFDLGRVFTRDEHGAPARMVGVEQDITERKRAEDDQRLLADFGAGLASTLDFDATARNIARLLAGELADVCLVETFDEHGRLHRELAARSGTAAPLPQFPGSAPVFESKQPALVAAVTPEDLAALVRDEPHRRALGELALASLMVLPLPLGPGRSVGSLALARTSSAARYTPADLALAEKAASRAALAVEKARLYRTAQRAIQARDDVLGIVAHDLRNPLSAILVQTQCLQRAAAGPPSTAKPRARASAVAIERAATRMNRLIEDLLDVTRIEAGRLAVEQARVSARQAALDAVEAQEPLAASASIRLRVDVARDLPDVWADRDRVIQLLDNLIGNAVKFTPPGGQITVGAAPPRDGGDEVLFWVADTGAGIAAEQLPHVFDRFWQARKAERRGAGLGLPIVKGIVEAHGGRIWVESAPGRGSTFYFTLPKAVSTSPQPARPSPPQPGP